MSERTCETCGETKPRKAFWGVNRAIMKTCTDCRRKEARHKRYKRAKKKADLAETRRLAKLARDKMRAEVKLTNTDKSIKYINQKIASINNKLQKYMDKMTFGGGTNKTKHAIIRQTKNVEYYEELKELVMSDAALGYDKPIEYYLDNTYLLNKHGFPCVVTDENPRSDENGN